MNNSVKIIINGLSAKTGGGVRYLSNLLRFVPSNYHITLILNRESKIYLMKILIAELKLLHLKYQI